MLRATPKLSQEERTLLLARSHLLRAQGPPAPPAYPPLRAPLAPLAPLAPPLGLQTLWAQMAQLHQLNSALLAQSQSAHQSPAAIFSSLMSQASQRVSPYIISSPSPPPSHSNSRSPSPVQVET